VLLQTLNKEHSEIVKMFWVLLEFVGACGLAGEDFQPAPANENFQPFFSK